MSVFVRIIELLGRAVASTSHPLALFLPQRLFSNHVDITKPTHLDTTMKPHTPVTLFKWDFTNLVQAICPSELG
jgi:hypothetical protein